MLKVDLINKRQSSSIKRQRQRLRTSNLKAVISQAWKTWQTKHNVSTVWWRKEISRQFNWKFENKLCIN